jgi:hypothetical protein
MARFGKRLLSAFIETGEEKAPEKGGAGDRAGGADASGAGADSAGIGVDASGAGAGRAGSGAAWAGAGAADQRFADYFDKLFSDANIPGPDYYEFSKMITAMQLVPDEQARYYAAYAGLQVQGLDKQKLMSTAAEYLRVLTADAGEFQKTVESALQEKVHSRMVEAEEKGRRIQTLSQEILKLQEEIGAMQREIGENKEKLTASSNAYATESGRRKQQIEADIQKINHYIH